MRRLQYYLEGNHFNAGNNCVYGESREAEATVLLGAILLVDSQIFNVYYENSCNWMSPPRNLGPSIQ